MKFTVHVSWFDKEYMNETSDANRGQDPNPGKEVTSFCAPMIKIKNADEANGDDGWYMHNGKAKGVIGGVVVSKAGYIQSIRGLVTAKVTLTCTLEKESDRHEQHKPLFFSQQYPFDYAELPVSLFLEDNADDLIENDANARRLFASKRQVSVVSNTDLSPDMWHYHKASVAKGDNDNDNNNGEIKCLFPVSRESGPIMMRVIGSVVLISLTSFGTFFIRWSEVDDRLGLLMTLLLAYLSGDLAADVPQRKTAGTTTFVSTMRNSEKTKRKRKKEPPPKKKEI